MNGSLTSKPNHDQFKIQVVLDRDDSPPGHQNGIINKQDDVQSVNNLTSTLGQGRTLSLRIWSSRMMLTLAMLICRWRRKTSLMGLTRFSKWRGRMMTTTRLAGIKMRIAICSRGGLQGGRLSLNWGGLWNGIIKSNEITRIIKVTR